jgi:hypothetical protein
MVSVIWYMALLLAPAVQARYREAGWVAGPIEAFSKRTSHGGAPSHPATQLPLVAVGPPAVRAHMLRHLDTVWYGALAEVALAVGIIGRADWRHTVDAGRDGVAGAAAMVEWIMRGHGVYLLCGWYGVYISSAAQRPQNPPDW